MDLIFRTRWLNCSVTYRTPLESTEIPAGPLKAAADPMPSAKLAEPDPATVVTTPAQAITNNYASHNAILPPRIRRLHRVPPNLMMRPSEFDDYLDLQHIVHRWNLPTKLADNRIWLLPLCHLQRSLSQTQPRWLQLLHKNITHSILLQRILHNKAIYRVHIASREMLHTLEHVSYCPNIPDDEILRTR